MKRTIATIPIITILIITVAALSLTACGAGTKTVTVIETVTATPNPSPTPYFTDLELEGLAFFQDMVPDLKHILNTENSALDYGVRTGDLTGVINKADHYSSDFKELNRNYVKTNYGGYYGGRLSHLEKLFEGTLEHVRKFGLGIVNVATGGGNASVTGTQSALADTDMEKAEAELDRLLAMASDPGSI